MKMIDLTKTNDQNNNNNIIRPLLNVTEVGLLWQLVGFMNQTNEFTFSLESNFTTFLKQICFKHLNLFILEGKITNQYQLLSWDYEKKCTFIKDQSSNGKWKYKNIKPTIPNINPDIKIIGIDHLNNDIIVDIHIEIKCIPFNGSRSFHINEKLFKEDYDQVLKRQSDVAIFVSPIFQYSKYLQPFIKIDSKNIENQFISYQNEKDETTILTKRFNISNSSMIIVVVFKTSYNCFNGLLCNKK